MSNNNIGTSFIFQEKVDADLVFRRIGEINVSKGTGDIWFVLQDPTAPLGKRYVQVGGTAMQDIIYHLDHHNIISPTEPDDYDRGTTWYQSELAVIDVDTTLTKDALIAIQVKDETTGNWEWAKIMTLTKAANVKINNSKTLADLIYDGRTMIIPATDFNEAQFGEIYVKNDRSVWFKPDANPANERYMGIVSQYDINKLQQQIIIANTEPSTYTNNSLFLHTNNAGNVARIKTIWRDHVSTTTVGGLKFDDTDHAKTGSVIQELGKRLFINLSAADNFGYTETGYDFSTTAIGTKSYIEFMVNSDIEKKVQFILTKPGYVVNSSNNYGSELDGSSLLITSDGYKFKNNFIANAIDYNNRRVYFMVNHTGVDEFKVAFGIVKEDGTRQPLFGSNLDNTSSIATMNLGGINLGATNTTLATAVTVIDIPEFGVLEIPANYTPLNQVLPGEHLWNNMAIVTNAMAIEIGNGINLDSWVDNGRVTIVPLPWASRWEAKIGELIFNLDDLMLYTRVDSNTFVPLAGKNDILITNHVANSLIVTTETLANVQANYFKVDDKSTIVVNKFGNDPVGNKTDFETFVADIKDPDKIIIGNMNVIDKELAEALQKFKIVLQRTRSDLIIHTYKDENNQEKDVILNEYITNIYNTLNDLKARENVYSGYAELDFKYSDILIWAQDTYMSHVYDRMKDKTIYIETVQAGNSDRLHFDFHVPVTGLVYTYKAADGHLYLVLKDNNGDTWTSMTNGAMSYKITAWNKQLRMIDNKLTIKGDMEIKKYVDPINSANNKPGDFKVAGNSSFTDVVVNQSFKLYNNTGANGLVTNIGSVNYNTIKTHSTSGGITTLIGDNNTIKLELNSVEVPTWNGIPLVTEASMGNYFRFRGILGSDNINTLFTTANIGYYTVENASYVIDANGYPDLKNRTCILKVYAYEYKNPSDVIEKRAVQEITVKSANKHHPSTWSRTYINDTWTEWIPGGAGGAGGDISWVTYGDRTIYLGDPIDFDQFIFVSPKKPAWEDEDGIYGTPNETYEFLIEADLEEILKTLYSKDEIDIKLAKKYDKVGGLIDGAMQVKDDAKFLMDGSLSNPNITIGPSIDQTAGATIDKTITSVGDGLVTTVGERKELVNRDNTVANSYSTKEIIDGTTIINRISSAPDIDNESNKKETSVVEMVLNNLPKYGKDVLNIQGARTQDVFNISQYIVTDTDDMQNLNLNDQTYLVNNIHKYHNRFSILGDPRDMIYSSGLGNNPAVGSQGWFTSNDSDPSIILDEGLKISNRFNPYTGTSTTQLLHRSVKNNLNQTVVSPILTFEHDRVAGYETVDLDTVTSIDQDTLKLIFGALVTGSDTYYIDVIQFFSEFMMQWNGSDLITKKMANELFNWKLLGAYEHVPTATDLWSSVRDNTGTVAPFLDLSNVNWTELKIQIPYYQLKTTSNTYISAAQPVIGDPREMNNSYFEVTFTKDMMGTPIFLGKYENLIKGDYIATVLYIVDNSLYWLVGVDGVYASYHLPLTLSKIYWR